MTVILRALDRVRIAASVVNSAACASSASELKSGAQSPSVPRTAVGPAGLERHRGREIRRSDRLQSGTD